MKKLGKVFLVTVFVAGLAATAVAQEGSKQRPKIGPWMPPNLALSADTKGDAKFEIGYGILGAFTSGPENDTKHWQWSVTPSVSLKTKDGVANVFGSGGGETTVALPWRIKLSTAFLRLAKRPPAANTEAVAAFNAATEKAVEICVKECAKKNGNCGDFAKEGGGVIQGAMCQLSPVPASVVGFCECANKENANAGDCFKEHTRTLMGNLEVREFLVGGLDWQSFCEEGKKPIKDADTIIPLRYPDETISFGAAVGQEKHKFLSPMAGTTAGYRLERHGLWAQFVEYGSDHKKKEEVSTPWSMGGHFAHVWLPPKDFSPTIEVLALYDETWEEQSAKGKWCKKPGRIVYGEDDDQTKADIDECEELPLGDPTRKAALEAGIFGGAVDQRRGWWRGAGGFVTRWIATGEESGQWNFGAKSPVFFRFAKAEKVTYEGLVRVTAEVWWISKKKENDGWEFLLTLSLLGQRAMFSDVFDEL